jgi:hypothetical protein
MADKILKRYFPIKCCKLFASFVFNDFAYDSKMDYICHNHPEPITQFLSWRGGIDEDQFKKIQERWRKNR